MRSYRFFIVILIVAFCAVLCAGCGGGASERVKTTVFIRDLRFDPQTLVVSPGTTVTWMNSNIASHTVTSGTLDEVADPMLQDIAIINDQFDPQNKDIRVGDTVRWTNRDLAAHQIRFAQNQSIEFTSPLLQENEEVRLKILHAGVFTYDDPLTPATPGKITVVGIPNPDGRFDSGGINQSETFQLTFNTPGTFKYFCKFHNVEEGTIIVR